MATKPEIITIEELMSLPLQFSFILSHKGDYIYYYSTISGTNEIYQYSFKTGKSIQVTNGTAPKTPRGNLKLSKDDKFLFFGRDPIEGNERYNLWRFDISSKQVLQLTDTPKYADIFKDCTRDSKRIIVGSDRDHNKNQIFTMNFDGSNTNQITHHSDHVDVWSNIFLSPDDKVLFYSTNDSNVSKNLDIWVYSFESNSSEKMLSLDIGSKERPYYCSSKNDFIVIGSDVEGFERVGIMYLATKEVQWFGSTKIDEDFGCLSEKTNQVLVFRYDGVDTNVISYDIKTGKEKKLNLPRGMYSMDTTVKDDKFVLLQHSDSIHRNRAILYDLSKDTYKEIIPSANGKFDSERDFYPAETITYKSTDNTIIQALLYKPKNKTNGETFPAIIMPHGGPTSHYTNSFREDCQLYASQGFVVLLPNVRGSTAYGNKFRDACLKDWGRIDIQDLEHGVKYLQSLPYVNNHNIGITGGSYGGYLTYMSMTKIPSYFKAGSAVVGISSLKLLYEGNKVTFPRLARYFEEQMGKPDSEEVKKLWEDRSAVNFLDQMSGVLQIVHTANDPRCPLNQAKVVKERLLELGKTEGKDFEYVIFDDAGHGSYEKSFRIESTHKKLDFFNKFLKF